ncbi:hypothetical protein NXW75_21695 [Bacteroides xylanisolvens]|nr:hypothetical protein [Bacteroides xylanisolvens]
MGAGQPVQVLQCKKGEQQQSVQEHPSSSVDVSSCVSFLHWNKHSSFKKQGAVDNNNTHKASM